MKCSDQPSRSWCDLVLHGWTLSCETVIMNSIVASPPAFATTYMKDSALPPPLLSKSSFLCFRRAMILSKSQREKEREEKSIALHTTLCASGQRDRKRKKEKEKNTGRIKEIQSKQWREGQIDVETCYCSLWQNDMHALCVCVRAFGIDRENDPSSVASLHLSKSLCLPKGQYHTHNICLFFLCARLASKDFYLSL